MIKPLFFTYINQEHVINEDHKLFLDFMQEYEDSPQTYRSYAKEIERFLLWCIHVRKIQFAEIVRNDVLAYDKFIKCQKPVENWCGKPTAKLRQGKINTAWRPFAGALSAATAQRTNVILKVFFNYLFKFKKITQNPFDHIRQKYNDKSKLANTRHLEVCEIKISLNILNEYIEKEKNIFKYVRAKYIVSLLFYTGMRISEVVNHSMNDFVLIDNNYYLRILGKGSKFREIPIPNEFLISLREFRRHSGFLTELPSYNEKTPLVPRKCLKRSLDPSSIHKIIKYLFNIVANNLDITDSKTASKLRAASAHWLRHSYVTYLLKAGVPAHIVQENAGHSSINTTMIYSHLSHKERHEATQKLSLNID